MNKFFQKIRSLFIKTSEQEYVSSTDDISYFLDISLMELDIHIIAEGVNHLRKILDSDTVQQIKMKHEKDPKNWWAFHHHGWGTAIRNSLRDNVCLDDKLPSKNWDDYYIQLVELACGLRK